MRDMRALVIVGALVLSTGITAFAREGRTATTEEVVKEITSEVLVGMKREEVAEKLSPLGVTFSYVPREYLKVIDQDTFKGAPLGGRFDMLTPFETEGGRKSEAAIHIELDMQERVPNVRVEGFGIR
jgi:hypothetical protein